MLLGGVNSAFAQSFTVSDAPSDGQWAANTHWYYIKNKIDNNNYAYLSTATATTDGEGNLKIVGGSAKNVLGLWCVVRDGEGYKFYNYAEGTGKVLGMTTVTSTTGGDARAKMYAAGSEVSGVVTTFYYHAAGINPDDVEANAFSIEQNSNKYWNFRSPYLARWDSDLAVTSKCVGSAFMFEEVTDLSSLTDEAKTLYESLLSNANTDVTSYTPYADVPFNHTQAQISALQNAIPSNTPTDVESYAQAAVTLNDAYRTFSNSALVPLVSGKLYRVVSAYSGFEDHQHVKKAIIGGTSLSWGNKVLTSAQQYWWAEPQTDGSYFLKNVYTGKYINYNANPAVLGETPQKVEIKHVKAGKCNIRVNSQGVLHANGHGGGTGVSGTLINFGTYGECGDGSASAWMVEEATLDEVRSITENTTTLTVPFDGKNSPCVGSKVWKEETIRALSGLSTVASFEEANSILTTVYPLSADAYSEVTFDANKLYRIVCVSPKTESGCGDGSHNTLTVNTSANTLVCAEPSNADFNQLWQFVEGSTAGQYALQNMNTTKYVGIVVNQDNYRVPLSVSENMLEIIAYATPGQFKLHQANNDNSRNCLFCENGLNDYRLSVWENGANSASAWYIIPVDDIEVSLNAVGDHTYATTYLPFAVSEVSGAKAYVGAYNADKTAVNLTKVDGFAANEGVMLYGETTADTKATLTIGGSATKRTDNAFAGTCTEISVAADDLANYLVMGRNTNGEIGFFKPGLQGEATTFTIKANRAYLENSANGTSSVMLNFGSLVEGIGEATVPVEDAKNAPIYDLTGRRVMHTVKGGLYIQNGKKFIVR